MYTNNCLYCEKVFENMTGKLFVSVKKPDEDVYLNQVCISDKTGLFSVSLVAGSVYILDVTKEMELCAHFPEETDKPYKYIKIKPDEFTHLQIDYEYYFCRNQPRIRNLRLQKIEHVSPDSLYNMKRR